MPLCLRLVKVLLVCLERCFALGLSKWELGSPAGRGRLVSPIAPRWAPLLSSWGSAPQCRAALVVMGFPTPASCWSLCWLHRHGVPYLHVTLVSSGLDHPTPHAVHSWDSQARLPTACAQADGALSLGSFHSCGFRHGAVVLSPRTVARVVVSFTWSFILVLVASLLPSNSHLPRGAYHVPR